MKLAAVAPAKVNLFLHVGPLDEDGYHPLEGLAVFSDAIVGDRLTVEASQRLSLNVVGPFSAGLGSGDDNLIVRAVRALAERCGLGEPGLRFVLDKQLPIASGVGGGSSDAAAALKLANRALGLDLDEKALLDIASVIGADGPMCVAARPVWTSGRGDELSPAPELPPLHAVLLNPGVPSPTGAVYRAYDAAPRNADRPAPPVDWTRDAVIEWLSGLRNDLEAPALALAPQIGEALDAMRAAPGVRLTRMSGSGGTVFGLFDDADSARAAAADLERPGWWVRACCLGSADGHSAANPSE